MIRSRKSAPGSLTQRGEPTAAYTQGKLTQKSKRNISGHRITVTLIEKGGTNKDGSKAPDKLVQQEWTRNQLVNYFQIQHSKIYTNALRGFQGLVQAHAAAQTITDIDGLKVQLQELREIPYEAYASLKKHQGITTEYIAELISLVRANIAQHESAGMTRAEAEAQPSNFLPGLSLGELLTLQGAAEERRDSAADTTEGKAKGITKGQSIEYGAFNITRADGSILIAYVAGRADVNDILEDLIEAHIKHTVATTGLTYTQLGNTIKEIEKHLPPVTMPDGKVEKLTLLPTGKTEYTQQNIIEAYSQLALANYLYNEQYLPLTQGGHRLLREIGRVVDTARLYKAIGDAWFTYANSEQGKTNLANGGQTFADLLTNAGFKIGTLVAQARATAEQTQKVIEGRDFQPDPAQEVKALINRAEAEQQLADINARQAAEPTIIPAAESITGKEITVEPKEETIVNSQSAIGNLSDPAANLRNLIAQGKATEKDFAEFFTKHPITHAAAIQQGLVPINQQGQPSAAYIKGRQEAQTSTASMSIIDPSARTWNNYTDRVFYGLYDGMPRVEIDDSKFYVRTQYQRGHHVTEDNYRDSVNDILLPIFKAAYRLKNKPIGEIIKYIKKQLDFAAHGAYLNEEAVAEYLSTHHTFDKSSIGEFINSKKAYTVDKNINTTWTLEQFFDAPELYAAYPHLKQMFVRYIDFEKAKPEGRAWGNVIEINTNANVSKVNKKEIILHEIQHFIQDYEGFPNGTSRQQAYTDFLTAYERARAELDAAGLTRYSSDKRILGSERINKLSPDEQSILKKYLALKKIDNEFGYNPSILARFIDFLKGNEKQPSDAYKFYFLSAGEAEARNVQRRSNMSEAERKAIPFNSTLDVAVEEAIVTFHHNYLSQHGTSVPTTPTFSIKAAQPAADRFKASPLGHNMLYFIRNEARRYARIFGDKSPQEQAVNAAQSAAAIIAGVDKYLQRTGTESKPVPQSIRRRLQHLQKVAEKYAQIIATGRARSFKKLAPQEQAELQAAIADLQQQEQEAAITNTDQLLTDSQRMNKRTRDARAAELRRRILREAAKGRVYATLAAMLDAAADALDTHLKNEILVDINRITAPVKIKRTASGRLKGKMTAPIYRKLEQAIQFMALSPRALETAADDIFTAQDALATAINEGDKNLTSGNALLIQLAGQLTQDGIKVTPQTLTAALTEYSNALFQLIQF